MLRKEIHDNQLFLFNEKGILIFKRWLKHGYSLVFDIMPYHTKKSYTSITDEGIKYNFKNGERKETSTK